MRKVSIITPTRNEEEGISKFLEKVLPYGYEVVVADDSDDKTPEIAERMGAKVVIGRRLGLAQAVLDAIDATNSDYIILIDSDLQHPTELIPEIVNQLDYQDLVVVTKHNEQAMAELSWWRKIQSNLGVWSAQVLIPAPVSDPMAGYFGIRRKCLAGIPRGEYYDIDEDKFANPELELPENWLNMSQEEQCEWLCERGIAAKKIGIEAIGFKIGLELFAKAKWVSHSELPMVFAKRETGMSKGTAHSLQKHLWRLFKNSLSYEVELPIGSEEYYAFYEANDWQRDWKQSIASVLQQISLEIKPDRLIDIGCGSSPQINYMYAKEKVGIDINEAAMRFMRIHSKASFQTGSLLDVPFPDKSFDMVTCIEVIEHLYENQIEKGLSEITRVLKDGGYAVLATPNYSSILWNVIEKAQQFLQKGEWTSDHHTKFNRKRLTEMCSKYGLEEIRYDGIMNNMDMVITYRKVG
jgi:glycosyltransferase involved in cell wall biosynthesis